MGRECNGKRDGGYQHPLCIADGAIRFGGSGIESINARKQMTNWAEDQAEFMLAGGQTVNEINHDQMQRYLVHIAEESQETYRDYMAGDMVKALDGAIDTIVVAIGFIRSMGVNPNEAWNAVHAANMRKVIDGQVYRRDDGQIGKPPGWYGPEKQLAGILDRAGFQV